MKFKGGHDICLKGRPSATVTTLPEPQVLYLPRASRRFAFTELCVAEGQQIHPGDALARDPANHNVPLLSPRAGTVGPIDDLHIPVTNVAIEAEDPYAPSEDSPHAPPTLGSGGMKRMKLLDLGAWQFVHDAHTGELPDPLSTPSAVIASTLCVEPYTARGNVQLRKRLNNFTRGLEHLQSLLDYQEIHLVLPDIQSDFAKEVRETLRGYAFVKLLQVPLRFPFDDFALIARKLGLKPNAEAPVWALRTEGVLAFDRALTHSRPCTVRIVTLGGPHVDSPGHMKLMPGYPLADVLADNVGPEPRRVIAGGVFDGSAIKPEQLGLDTECTGLTVLAEATEREFLGWITPGFDRRSYSKCFGSLLSNPGPEALTTAVRGEGRPCISCNFCEEVCPAGIMPHLLHKYIYQDLLEETEAARIDLCIECGLCSYVCPSKLELRCEFVATKQRIAEELHPEPETTAETEEVSE